MIVQFNNISKIIDGEYIFENINFTINNKDKIGLIGLNGVGKTTLIKMILGITSDDYNRQNEKGKITISKNSKIDYLSQNIEFFNEDNTVIEELYQCFKDIIEIYNKLQKLSTNLEKNKEEYTNLLLKYEYMDGYNIDYKINYIINGMNLEKLKDKKLKVLSGGEKTRVALSKILLNEPDLLILDEPTNHLDLSSIEWLENYLNKYSKAVLLISHDRNFLENVVNRIFEIENKELEVYNTNFSDFLIQKELILKGEIKKFEKEQNYIKKMEEFIERYRAGIKAKQARGREKILSRFERSKNPVFSAKRMKLKFETNKKSSDKVLELDNVDIKNADNKLAENISFSVFRGDKIGIIGKNGIGKSTLLKQIISNYGIENSKIKFGSNVEISYFSQNLIELNNDNTILEEINENLNKDETYYRNLLGGFLFYDDDKDKKISKLSGGEKVRIQLLKLMLKNSNFLILDEPTNHLDLYSIEILEEALEKFDGTILLVSHNRHFLDSICNKIYHLSKDKLEIFNGNYEEYKKQNETVERINNSKEENKKNFLIERQKKKELDKLNKKIMKIEEELEKLQKNIEEYSEKMYNLGNNYEEVLKIQESIDTLKIKEDNLMEEWDNHMKKKEEYE